MYARLYDGYDTPDYKVAYSLAFRLAGMKGFRVFTKTMRDNDNNRRYKVWVEYS